MPEDLGFGATWAFVYDLPVTGVCVRSIAPYVKVYLMDGKTCVEKQKTMTARRTLDPLYQQQLCFTMPYNGKILQVRHRAVLLFLLPTWTILACNVTQIVRN